MKKLLIFGGLGLVAFVGWQWYIGRRTNTTIKQYNDATKASQKEGQQALNTQLAAYQPMLANLVSLSGRIFNNNPIAPILRSDGTLVSPDSKDLSDVDDSHNSSFMLFGAQSLFGND